MNCGFSKEHLPGCLLRYTYTINREDLNFELPRFIKFKLYNKVLLEIHNLVID